MLQQGRQNIQTGGNPGSSGIATQSGSCDVQRGRGGAILVRMHSVDRQGRPLPDAVFTFRVGNPQYDFWEREAAKALAARR